MKHVSGLVLLALTFGCASPAEEEDTAAAGPETAAAGEDNKSDSSELRVRAGKMTVWIDRHVAVRLVDGEPQAIVKGRASRTLSAAFAFVPDDAFGEASVTGARSFEVRLRSGHEINSIFSGLPLLVSLDAPSDEATNYTLQLDLRPAFGKFEGSQAVFVGSTTRPIFIGKEAADPLRYSTRVTTSESTLTVANAGSPQLVPAAGGFDVLMSYADLETAWRAGAKVAFTTGGGTQKRAALEARASEIAMTTADPYDTWPAPTCAVETYNCTLEHQGVDLQTCGDYREVSHCAFADICEITNEAPLALTRIELGFAWETQAEAYREACNSNGTSCSLGTIDTFTIPECLADEPTIARIVAQTAAQTDDQDFVAGPFEQGDVLDRVAVQATPGFSTSYSSGGPALFQAIDSHMGGGEIRAWTVVEEVPCHNCTAFRSKLFLWYPAAFRVVAIEGGHGFDS